MRRDKFAGGEKVESFFDQKSGAKMFPYTARVVIARSIWKAKKEPLGMLMVKEYFSAPEFHAGWEVCFRVTETKEEFTWNLQEKDILENYDPVFYMI